MEYLKSVLNYFLKKDGRRENDNNDLGYRLTISTNDDGGGNIGEINPRNRDQEITDSIFNKLFPQNTSNEDNNILGFFSNRHHPFFGFGAMDIPSIDNYFENLTNEMERHFQDMMGFQDFSGFNLEDFQGQNFQNNKQLMGDSLRDYYLNTSEVDVTPEMNQQIERKNNHSVPGPFGYSYQRVEKITYKVNQDGTAEVTQIVKGQDGKEEKNVTKFKLK